MLRHLGYYSLMCYATSHRGTVVESYNNHSSFTWLPPCTATPPCAMDYKKERDKGEICACRHSSLCFPNSDIHSGFVMCGATQRQSTGCRDRWKRKIAGSHCWDRHHCSNSFQRENPRWGMSLHYACLPKGFGCCCTFKVWIGMFTAVRVRVKVVPSSLFSTRF